MERRRGGIRKEGQTQKNKRWNEEGRKKKQGQK